MLARGLGTCFRKRKHGTPAVRYCTAGPAFAVGFGVASKTGRATHPNVNGLF
jgi:hypothetical protein